MKHPFLLFACTTCSIFSALAQIPPSVSYRNKTFRLSFWDEFSGPRVDSSKWVYRTDSKVLSTQLPKNNEQKDGILRQFLRKETAGGKNYTAGGVISKDTLHYGYYEAMIKTPPKKGWHSGFWLMKHDGSGSTSTSKASIEIDILENESENLNSFTCLHKKYGSHKNFGIRTFNTSTLNQRFMKVGCLYEKDSIIWYYDNRQIDKRYIDTLRSFGINVFLTSIGYTAPINESVLPSTFEVDYFRFYELNPPAKNTITLSPVADSYLQNGSSANSNFGTLATLESQNNGAGDQKEAIFRFDLSSVKYYIGSAKLRVFARNQTNNSNPVRIRATGLVNTSIWNETLVNWNNKPAESGVWNDEELITGSTGKYYEWDVTAYIQAQKELNYRNSVGIKLSQIPGFEDIIEMVSREGGSNMPQLIIKPIENVPVITFQPKDTVWMKDSILQYQVQVSTVKPPFFQWKKNGVAIPGANASTLSFPSLQLADSGNYSVSISYGIDFDTVESKIGKISVRSSNLNPIANFISPLAGSDYAMGQVISLSGNGTDPETGPLKNPDIRWSYRYFRNGTLVTSQSIGAGFNVNFAVPITTETGTNVFYRIFMVARDPQGGRDSVWRDIFPRIRNVVFQTSPANLQIRVNGIVQTSPHSLNLIEGSLLPLDVPDPQTNLVFQSWSQGGTQTQTYIVPGSNSSPKANLIPGNITIRNTIADAYVLGTSNTNFGTQNIIGSKFNGATNQIRESYLRFNLASLPGNVLNARLRLYGGLSDNTNPIVKVDVRQVNTSASWEENTVNWSNKPATISTVLASRECIGMTKAYYEWDLTSFIQSQVALGRTTVNLHLSSPNETASRVDFNSKEATSFLPELRFALASTPPVMVSHPASQSVCEGQSVNFTSSASGNPSPTVQWQESTNSGSNWNNIPGANAGTYSFTTNLAQNGNWYRAVWTNEAGVQSSNPASLTVNPKPLVSISANGPLTFCAGGSVQLSALPLGSYLWSNGATSSSIAVNSSGTFTVTVTDANLCSDQASETVTVNPNPAIFNVTGGGTYCAPWPTGVSVGLSNSETGINYQFWFSGGDSISSLAGTGSALLANGITGTGSVVVKARNASTGCWANMNGNAWVQSLPNKMWYEDFDGDGFGNPLVFLDTCFQPAGFVDIAGDCQDSLAATACYCKPADMVCSGASLQTVQVNTLNVSEPCIHASGYKFYPTAGAFTTVMQRGLAYPYSIQTNNINSGLGIWCDFNEDNDFDDPTEFLFGSSEFSNLFSGNLQIPEEAQTGMKRFRIRTMQGVHPTSADACTFFAEGGETKDFTLELSQPEMIIANVLSDLCAGTDLSVSFNTTGTFLAGNTFQVQISGPGGSFSAGSGVSVIGRGNASPIACHISLATMPGTYRLRVVSSTPLPSTFGLKSEYFQIKTKPAAPTAVHASRCGVGPVTVSATGCSIFEWYDAQWRGNKLADGANYTSPSINSNRTYFAACVDAEGCRSLRTAVQGTVTPMPVVVNFSPSSGNVNQAVVTINGAGFAQIDSVVFSGNKRSVIQSNTSSSIQVLVPIGCISGPIRVFTKCGSSLSASSFTPVVPTVGNPVFSVAGGIYSSPQSVGLSCSSPGAEIYYTLNGTYPVMGNANTFKYSGSPISVGTSLTIRAFAFFNGWTNSAIVSETYTISSPMVVATPVISPSTGVYAGGQVLNISCSTPQATIWFTTNGQVPVVGQSSTMRYMGPITLISTMTIRAIAVRSGWSNSGVAVSFLTISGGQRLLSCVFSPPAGVYSTGQSVSITNPDPLAQIYFTTDGTDPHMYMPLARPYAGPVAISSSRTLMAQAFRLGFGDSPRTTGNYSITAGRAAFSEEDMEDIEKAKYKIQPNPFHQRISISRKNSKGSVRMMVYNASGRLVQEEKTTVDFETHTMDVKDQSPGLYFIHILEETGASHSFRVLKE